MNEQIKELVHKSGLAQYRTKDIYNWEFVVTDFAEQLIKECDRLVSRQFINRGTWHSGDLLKTFNIKD
jgi:hypothetical protein